MKEHQARGPMVGHARDLRHAGDGDVPVHAVDVSLVHKVLDPIWNKKTETASRVRGRIEAILDWATVRGFRKGDNAALKPFPCPALA